MINKKYNGDNWIILLSIDPFSREASDPQVLSRIMKEAKAEFTKLSMQNPKYKTRVKQSVQMEEDLKNPDICKNLILEAQKEIEKQVDNIISRANDEIKESALQNIAIKNNVTVDYVRERAKKMGKKVAVEKDYTSVYEKYCKPLSGPLATKYRAVGKELETLKIGSIYQLLLGEVIVDSSEIDIDELRQIANKILSGKEVQKHNEKATAMQRVCNFVMQTLITPDDIKKYNEYLAYEERMSILNGYGESVAMLCDGISDSVVNEAVGKLEKYVDTDTAEEILSAYSFTKYNIDPFAHKREESKGKYKYCRCGIRNDISDGRTNCRSCGRPLQIKCPKCGALVYTSEKRCSCGCDLDRYQFCHEAADNACRRAERYIEKLDFDNADIALRSAELKNAEFKEPEIERKISKVKATRDMAFNSVGSMVIELETAVEEKRYYKAKDLLTKIRLKNPEFACENEEEIITAIKNADAFIAKASSGSAHFNETEALQYCAGAQTIATDAPVKKILESYPPMPAVNLSVSANNTLKQNLLTWKGTSSKNGLIYYHVIRKENSIPANVNDGDNIGKFSECRIIDKNIMPGIHYYYSVFVERSGVFSQGLSTTKAVVNYFEIANVRAVTSEDSVELCWDKIPKGASVRIERTDESQDHKKLMCRGSENYLDTDVVNDKKYIYHLYLEYADGYQTDGCNVTATPTQLPSPVSELKIKTLDADWFTVEWEILDGNSVKFFRSFSKPIFSFGDAVSMEELESEFMSVTINKQSFSDSYGTFKYSSEKPAYLIAVSVKGETGVIGKCVKINRGGELKNLKVRLVNGRIRITFDCPKDATGFCVVYRNDDYPESRMDPSACRSEFTINEYKYHGGIVLDTCDPKNYYFVIYIISEGDEGVEYSDGTELMFKNEVKKEITYAISVHKQFLRDTTIHVTFSSDTTNFTLPAIDIMSSQGRAPMFKKNGVLFMDIPEQEVKGNTTVSITIPKGMPRDTFVKPFLHDESLSGNYILKLKVGSVFKIN